jgi:hypothetical protein
LENTGVKADSLADIVTLNIKALGDKPSDTDMARMGVIASFVKDNDDDLFVVEK